MIETFEQFCAEYGDIAGEEILERICDAHWSAGSRSPSPQQHGVHFTDIIAQYACNHTLSGTITHEDKVFGFLIDNGNLGGTTVRYFFEEDQTVQQFYEEADEREARRIKRLRDAEEEKNEAIAKWEAHKKQQEEIKRKVQEEVQRLRRDQEESQRRRVAIRARRRQVEWDSLAAKAEKINWSKEGF